MFVRTKRNLPENQTCKQGSFVYAGAEIKVQRRVVCAALRAGVDTDALPRQRALVAGENALGLPIRQRVSAPVASSRRKKRYSGATLGPWLQLAAYTSRAPFSLAAATA